MNKTKIEELVVEAYTRGANDATDIYLYVSQFTNVTFEDIDGITTNIFGPINLTPCAPHNYRLN